MARDNDDGIFAFLLGMAIGAIGGGAAALLFAPKPGEETRKEVREYLKTLPKVVSDDISDPNGKTREFLKRTRINIENQVDRVNETIRANRLADAKRREEIASGVEYN